MKTRMHLVAALITVLSMVGGPVWAAPLVGSQARTGTAAPVPGAYVERGLAPAGGGQVSVIVTAGDSLQAAQAVEAVGGRVTSDLWLIDAVAAQVPSAQVAALGAQRDVVAVTTNKGVASADWDGWVVTTQPLPVVISKPKTYYMLWCPAAVTRELTDQTTTCSGRIRLEPYMLWMAA